jgi:hypothetical protein
MLLATPVRFLVAGCWCLVGFAFRNKQPATSNQKRFTHFLEKSQQAKL